MKRLKETEKAYYAGLLDGEGCIIISKNRGNPKWHTPNIFYYLEVCISNTNIDILKELKSIFGGSVTLHKDYKSPLRRRDVYRWRVVCQKAMHFLETVLPYLRIKRKQAELAIEFQKEISSHKFWRGVGKELPKEERERRERLYLLMKKLNERGRRQNI